MISGKITLTKSNEQKYCNDNLGVLYFYKLTKILFRFELLIYLQCQNSQ